MPLLRSAFISLSHNRTLRHFCERSRLGRRLSSRFVAGMTVGDVLYIAETLSNRGIRSTLDFLGESVTTEADAREAADTYHQLLDWIASQKINANVSLKLTQMGLSLSPELAEQIVTELAEHASANNCFVRVDMEDSSLTQITLDIVRRIHVKPGLQNSIGIVIQSYLYRSHEDVQQLLADGIRIRLCKGAYKEPAAVAFPKKSDVDANYIRLSEEMLQSPIFHGFATHDETMIAAIKAYTHEHGIAPEHFEFQMLYGIRNNLQAKLVEEGYNLRVYVPFGNEWYPYFMRRLAERPANLLFLTKSLFRA